MRAYGSDSDDEPQRPVKNGHANGHGLKHKHHRLDHKSAVVGNSHRKGGHSGHGKRGAPMPFAAGHMRPKGSNMRPVGNKRKGMLGRMKGRH